MSSEKSSLTNEKKTFLENDKVLVYYNNENPFLIQSMMDKSSNGVMEFTFNHGFKIMSQTPEEQQQENMFFKHNVLSDFELMQINKDEDKNCYQYELKNDKFCVNLKHTLPRDRTYIKQETLIKNISSSPIVIASIMPIHCVLPPDYFKRIEMSELGYPAYFSNDSLGLVFSLDFPGAHIIRIRMEVIIEYRPMIRLEPGETYEVFSSGYIMVPDGNPHNARKMFHSYVTDACDILDTYPVPFCTWGPWLRDPNEYQAMASIPHLKKAGSEMFLLDLGYIHKPNRGKMIADNIMPTVDNIDSLYIRERFPNGVKIIKEATDKHGVELGLHFDINRNINEVPSRFDLPVRNGAKYMTYYNMGGSYYTWLKKFIHAFIDKYDPAMIKIDFNFIHDMCWEGDGFYANGFDLIDKQFLNLVDLLKSFKEKKADMYNYIACGNGFFSPYLSFYIDQVHTEDPGADALFRANFGKYPIYRVLAITRRSSWFDRYYDKWFPPHMIKMDISGHAYQQKTPSAVYPEDEEYLISEGIDWEYTLFSTLCCTRVKDLRFNILAMTEEELAFNKKWLEWSHENRSLMNDTVVVSELPPGMNKPDIFMHIKHKKAILYIVPGFAEVPEWIDISLSAEHNIPAQTNSLRYKIIYPFTGNETVIQKVNGTYDLNLPGPQNCAAIIAEIEFFDETLQFNTNNKTREQEFVTHVSAITESYPAILNCPLNVITTHFRKEKPVIIEWGETVGFHKKRDELLLHYTKGMGAFLSNESIESFDWDNNNLPDKNIIFIGHGEKNNVMDSFNKDMPELIEKFGVRSLKLPGGELYNCGIVQAMPHHNDKIIVFIIGRSIDEAALALRMLDNELEKTMQVLTENIIPQAIQIGSTESFQVSASAENVPFLRISPKLGFFSARTDFDYDRINRFGAVQLKLLVEDESQPIYEERIVPFFEKHQQPPVLPLSRYICLKNFLNTGTGGSVTFSLRAEPLTEHSKTAVKLGKPQIVTLPVE